MNEETNIALDGISDITLEVNPTAIEDLCSQWESQVASIDLESIDAQSVYSSLMDSGVGTSYFPSLDNALLTVENAIVSTSNIIKSATQSQTEVDDRYSQNATNYGGGGSGGGGNGGGSSPTSDSLPTDSNLTDDSLVPGETIIPDMSTSVDNTGADLGINDEFVSSVLELDPDAYQQFMLALDNISKDELLMYLADEGYSSNLKKVLLESPKISEDLKKIISEMDENELQVTLQSIFANKDIISDFSKNIIYNYTQALKQNLMLQNVNKGYVETFFDQVEDFYKITQSLVESENIQETLLSIYEGNYEAGTISDDQVLFYRSVIDGICESNNILYEDLLTNKSNAQLLKNSLGDINNSLVYCKLINKMGPDTSNLLFENVIKDGVIE